MDSGHILFICIAFLICISIAQFIRYLMFKWTFRIKFILIVETLETLLLFLTAYIFYNEFTILRTVILAVVLGALSHFATEWFMRSLIRPLNTISECLEALSRGDFTKTIPLSERRKSKDEFENIFRKINIMTSEISFLIASIKGSTVENVDMAEQLSRLSITMSEKADNTSSSTNALVGEVKELSSNMTASACEMDQASTHMRSISDAVENLTGTITELAKNSGEAATQTVYAVKKTQKASKQIEELGTAAQDIEKFSEAITDISEQTNLLALNATIEAARAGESGKGFAVVASEIKELSRQTADTTQDIKLKVESIRKTTSATIHAITEILEITKKVNETVFLVAAALEEQTTITDDIANNISQASSRIQSTNNNAAKNVSITEKIVQDIDTINSNADETSAGSSQLKNHSQSLAKLAGQLRDGLERFKVLDYGKSATAGI